MLINRPFRIMLVESDIVYDNKQANLDQLEKRLARYGEDADLVILPEMFTTGFLTADADKAVELAERNSGDTIKRLHDLAEQYQVAFAGSFLASTASQLYNRAFFIEPNGDETFYDKRHLFSMGGENKVYHQGKKNPPIIRFRGMNIKLIVCYDLRFPVFCRNVDNEYDMLVVVANWPKARHNAWKALLMARAIENECYVCGVNRCGTDSQGVDYGKGSSFIFDFKGRDVTNKLDAYVSGTEVSLDDLKRFREKFPVWADADKFTLL